MSLRDFNRLWFVETDENRNTSRFRGSGKADSSGTYGHFKDVKGRSCVGTGTVSEGHSAVVGSVNEMNVKYYSDMVRR
jgi:hypothetical protein